MRSCVSSVGVTKCTIDIWILIWPKEVFSCISHALTITEFDKFFYLGFRYGWICSKFVKCYLFYIFIISPFVYGREVFS